MAVRTKTQLEAEIRSKLESAGTPRISAAELRSVFKDFLDSMALEAGLKPFARSGGPQVPDTEIPAGIMRDSEFTQAAVLSLLGLTTQELNDLLTGASLSGGVLTFPQNDGTNISITLPTGGGGGGTADGVVSSAAFSNDGMTLTLTLSTGTTVQASVPAVLRQAGLSQSQVQALINAAEADDLDAADVAAQIQAAVMSRRIPEAPAAEAEARKYELQVPTSGLPTWERAAGESSGGVVRSAPPVAIATLGQPNLANSAAAMSGVLDSSGGTTGLKFAIDSTENNVRFNPAIAGHSLPEGASYASGTGILTLPAGVWVVEAVVALEIAASSGSIGSSASASVVGRLYEGGELRYSEDSFYWRQIAHDPVVSVTGSLMVQEGSTDTVQVRLLAEPGSTTNNLEVVVTAAHMEALRIGDSQEAAMEQHIRAGWSADTSISDGELSATSPTDTITLGSAAGFNYLALWRSDADGGDPTEVHIAGGGNARNTFGDAVNRAFGGVDGKLIVSVTRQNASLLSGEQVRLV